MSEKPQWSLYLIRTRYNHLYCGITTDVERRFHEHCHTKQGARALKGKAPLTLVFQQTIGSKSLALTLEARVKRLRKADKEALVRQQSLPNSWLTPLEKTA